MSRNKQEAKKFSPKNKNDLGKMPLPSLGPIPLKNVEFRNQMGPRLGNGKQVQKCL